MRRAAVVLALLALTACDNGGATPDWSRMITQPKALPFAVDMRPVPAGTVTRDRIGDAGRRDGRDPAGQLLTALPVTPTRALLGRGRARFGIVCAACHGIAGDGDSAVARAMQLRRPPSLHEPRIRALSAGRLFQVITEGYGLMPSFAAMLPVDDRWAVVAYVETLQLSWQAPVDRLPSAVAQELR